VTTGAMFGGLIEFVESAPGGEEREGTKALLGGSGIKGAQRQRTSSEGHRKERLTEV
jgi:hypothetical protein